MPAAAAAYLLFAFRVDSKYAQTCCSGAQMTARARQGDLVILPRASAQGVIAGMPGDMLIPVIGKALGAVKKALDVKTVDALAAMPHATLQGARPAYKAALAAKVRKPKASNEPAPPG